MATKDKKSTPSSQQKEKTQTKPKGPVPDYKLKKAKSGKPAEVAVLPLRYWGESYIREFVGANDGIYVPAYFDESISRQICWNAAAEFVKSYLPAGRAVLFSRSKSGSEAQSHKEINSFEFALCGALVTGGSFKKRLRFWKFVGYIGNDIFPPGVRFEIDAQTFESNRAECMKQAHDKAKAVAKQWLSGGLPADGLYFAIATAHVESSMNGKLVDEALQPDDSVPLRTLADWANH